MKKVTNIIKVNEWTKDDKYQYSCSAQWGEGCQVGSGGAVTHVSDAEDTQELEEASRYMRCTVLDLIQAMGQLGEPIECEMTHGHSDFHFGEGVK